MSIPENEKSETKQIIIADDHPIVRAGLKQIINEEKHLNLLAEVSDGIELLERLKKESFDLLILDISMPGESGLDILKQVKFSYPNLFVLILSTYPEEIYAERSLKAGASGYLNKQYATRELVQAINKILAGQRFISSSAAEKIALKSLNNIIDLPHEKLSDRELQVLIEIGKGKSISEISSELLLSTKTISTYRSRLMEKMELKTTTEIIKYVLYHKLIE